MLSRIHRFHPAVVMQPAVPADPAEQRAYIAIHFFR